MKNNIEILNEIFEPTSFDCKTPIEDLQIAIALNPDLNKILLAMDLARKQALSLCVMQRSELLQALKGIVQCCDGNEPKHEQIYHIANDAIKACNYD